MLRAGEPTVAVVSAAAYRGERGELRVADQDVLFDFASGGVTIGFPSHTGAQVEHGDDWIEFDSLHGTFRFEQVSDVLAIVEAAENLPALQLAC
jgi:hypothetical protein